MEDALAVDGFEGVFVGIGTRLDFDEDYTVSFHGDNVGFEVTHAPVAFNNGVAPRHEVFVGELLAPTSDFVMACQGSVLGAVALAD